VASRLEALQRAVDAYEELRRAVRANGQRNGAAASTQLGKFAQELVRVVGAGTNGKGEAVMNEAHVLELTKRMQEALDRFTSGDQIGAVYGNGWKETKRLMSDELPNVYRLYGTSALKLDTAAKQLTEQARAQWGEGYQTWVSRFRAAGVDLKNDMRDLLITAQRDGWDHATLARNLLRNPRFQFSNLPPISQKAQRIFDLGGTLSPSDALVRRAHVIARTEMAGVANRMHRDWTSAAGMDLYINSNSAPVAQECIEANYQDPMTWEDWQNWTASNGRGGVAPRHPNCDSLMMAVPRSYRGTAKGIVAQRRGGTNG